jgi:hypothetical protein
MNARKQDYRYSSEKGKCEIIINSTPDKFENGLFEFVKSVQDKSHEEPVGFICAWNEWAEGNGVEPDIKHGLAFLEQMELSAN